MAPSIFMGPFCRAIAAQRPIQWAMANGDPETGVCAMKLDEGLDTGPVYACERTPIDPEESVQQLSERLADLGPRADAAKRGGHCCGNS